MENAELDLICMQHKWNQVGAKIQLKVGEVKVKKNHQWSGTDCGVYLLNTSYPQKS